MEASVDRHQLSGISCQASGISCFKKTLTRCTRRGTTEGRIFCGWGIAAGIILMVMLGVTKWRTGGRDESGQKIDSF